MTTYKYSGDGAGIPGLPFEITGEDVHALPEGLTKQFRAALEAGLYVEIPAGRTEAESVGSRPQRKSKAGTPPEGE